jgi:hypothetical protein
MSCIVGEVRGKEHDRLRPGMRSLQGEQNDQARPHNKSSVAQSVARLTVTNGAERVIT